MGGVYLLRSSFCVCVGGSLHWTNVVIHTVKKVSFFSSRLNPNAAFSSSSSSESVLLIKDLGVQLQTRYTSGREESEVSS